MSDFTPISGTAHLLSASAEPEVPVNEMADVVERMGNSVKEWTVSIDFTCTQSEFSEGILHELNGSPAAAFAFGVYPVSRFFIVRNNTGKNCTVYVQGQSGAGIDVPASGSKALHSDGVNIVEVVTAVTSLRAMVRKAVDQTAANYTAAGGVAVAFDQEVYDTGDWHDNSVNNTRLTVPSGVNFVQVGASLQVQLSNADTYKILYIKKNGSTTWDGRPAQSTEVGTNTGPNLSISSGDLSVVAGDYFELFYQEESDASITVTAAETNFWIKSTG